MNLILCDTYCNNADISVPTLIRFKSSASMTSAQPSDEEFPILDLSGSPLKLHHQPYFIGLSQSQSPTGSTSFLHNEFQVLGLSESPLKLGSGSGHGDKLALTSPNSANHNLNGPGNFPSDSGSHDS